MLRPTGQGDERKDKAYELRPQPYSKGTFQVETSYWSTASVTRGEITKVFGPFSNFQLWTMCVMIEILSAIDLARV